MIRLFERLVAIWVGVTLFALMAVILADVVLRNIFNAPLTAGTEIAELLMGAMGFGTLPLLALQMTHISVDLVQIRQNGIAHRLVGVATSLASAAIFWVLAQRMYLMTGRTARSGEILPQLGISWSWVWWLLLVLSSLTLVVSLVAAVRSALGTHVPQQGAEL